MTQTATPILTPTSAGEPVKIGAIMAWSGPMRVAGMLADQIIALMEDQVKNMGGILGGREVNFLRCDDQGTVAQSVAQAEKLALEKVSALTLGGESAAQYNAVADIAEEHKVPYVAIALSPDVADHKYSACVYGLWSMCPRVAIFEADVVKPKTVAFLGYDTDDTHHLMDGFQGVVGVRDCWKAKGIDIVYEQYFPLDMVDFSPYLTKIKYVSPDIFVSFLNSTGQSVAINKQLMELVGWGSMKYYWGSEAGTAKAAVTKPAAVGTYVAVNWLPGSDDPGMMTFEDDFTQKCGRPPTPELATFYNCVWVAIKAIEHAGTDNPVKFAEALRSGNLECDSAWGHLRIPPDGRGKVKLMVAQIQEGGTLVKVWP